MEIVQYGDPVLGKKAVPVQTVTPELRALASEMLSAMYAAEGVGLAAEQVGRTEALCVIDVPPDAQGADAEANAGVRMPMVMFNPVVSDPEGTQRGSEGCLSFPGVSAQVTRGKHCSARVRGLLARAVQHEVDHLGGVVFVDRVSSAQALLLRPKLARLRKDTLARKKK